MNERLNLLHGELRGYFDCLHGSSGGQRSFHELCGEWLALRTRAGVELPEVEGVTVELLRQHRADAEEVLKRALDARWPENPFRNRLGIALSSWLGTTTGTVRVSFEAAIETARAVDAQANGDLLPLDAHLPALDQAVSRRELSARLQAAAQRGFADVAARLSADANWARWRCEWDALAVESERLARPLERELTLQVKGSVPTLAEAGRRMLALDQWSALTKAWKRFFARSAKKAVLEALAPLALPLTLEGLERARQFYLGLKARHRLIPPGAFDLGAAQFAR